MAGNQRGQYRRRPAAGDRPAEVYARVGGELGLGPTGPLTKHAARGLEHRPTVPVAEEGVPQKGRGCPRRSSPRDTVIPRPGPTRKIPRTRNLSRNSGGRKNTGARRAWHNEPNESTHHASVYRVITS